MLPVLVIEDDPADRAWLAATLRRGGYEVELATTGREAIELSRHRRFKAVTLDLLLPDMSGWDVLREIRSVSLDCEVPVIAVTVSADQGRTNGFCLHDFFVKPVPEGALLASLQSANAAPAGSSVLVVDDDPASLRLAEATLKHLGYRPICALGAGEGLRAAASDPPAAVIVDLLMPGMDGLQFVSQLQQTAAGRSVPIIFWTAKDLSADQRSRLRASAHALVSKSDDGPTALTDVLRSLLGASSRGEEQR